MEFEEPAQTQEARFVQETKENEEDSYESIACVLEEDVIDLDYETRAVQFWKCGKSKRRSLDSVSHKFKKVESQREFADGRKVLMKVTRTRKKYGLLLNMF